MSSTGRGSERETNDQYFSRYPTALAICEKLRDDGVIVSPRTMLEPSAGAGAFVSAMAETWTPSFLFRNDLDGSLILPEHEARASRIIENAHTEIGGRLISLEGDFKTLHKEVMPGNGVDAIIGNPPFSEAEEHIRHGITLLSPNGVLAFLLRVNFLAGIDRCSKLWLEHPPEYIYVLDKRPTFKEGWRQDKHTGKWVKVTTDSSEYAAFVFRKERPEFEPVTRWLRWSHYLKRFRNKVERIAVDVPMENGEDETLETDHG